MSFADRLPETVTIDSDEEKALVYKSGSNVVLRGKHEKYGSVIVKFITNPIQQGSAGQRLEKEYRVGKLMMEVLKDSPELVYSMYELVMKDNDRILIMEDFGAKPLSGKISVEQFFPVAIKVSKTLERFHANRLIHLDIKPDNIIVNDEGDAKVIDFGTVEFLTIEKSQLRSDETKGRTLAFMSPEQSGQLDDEHLIDHKSDIYSLGCTFYHYLTGKNICSSSDVDEIISFHLNGVPSPPHEVDSTIPQALSDLVMKMLSKNPNDRYLNTQTLVNDLERLQHGEIESDWQPGQGDINPMFSLPSGKLYGRQNDMDLLSTAIETCFRAGKSTSYICGPSGIGKSALVHEVVNQLENELIVSHGKFEQHRSLPFSAIANCLDDLVDIILSKPRKEFQEARTLLMESLGSDASLLLEILPRLDFLVNEQERNILEGTELNVRFQETIVKFLTTFTRITKKNVLMFIDDLQWADWNSLLLLEAIIKSERSGTVVVGAYRDNEVNDAHPLVLSMQSLVKDGVSVEKVVLDALPKDAVQELVSDTLRSDLDSVERLTEIIYLRTAGNPFFTRQFLKSLHVKELISFDFDNNCWMWDTDQIGKESFADNVVEFMLENIDANASDVTKNILSLAACVGTVFKISTLQLFYPDSSIDDLNLQLLQGIQEGWIFEIGNDRFKFAHDRIEEAFYTSLKQKQQENHYILGNVLKSSESEEGIFTVIHHLNRAIPIIIEKEDERQQLIELNLKAVRRAIDNCSAQLAIEYCGQAKELLKGWENDFENSWKIHYALIESLYFGGKLNEGFEAAKELLPRSVDDLSFFQVSKFLVLMCTGLSKYDDAYDTLIDCTKRGKELLYNLETENEDLMIPNAIEHYQIIIPLLQKAYEDPSTVKNLDDPLLDALLSAIGAGLACFFLTAKGSKNMYVQIVVIGTRLILEKGICEGSVIIGSAVSIASLALSGGNQDLSYMATKLMVDITEERFPTDFMRTEAAYHHLLFVGRDGGTIRDQGNRFFEMYRYGSASGNVIWAAYGGNLGSQSLFYSGVPVNEMIMAIDSVFGLSQQTANVLNMIMLQDLKNGCLYLQGKREKMTQKEEFLLAEFVPAFETPFLRCCTRFLRAYVGVFMESDYVETYNYALESESFVADCNSFIFMFFIPFLRLQTIYNIIINDVDIKKTTEELISDFRGQLEALKKWGSYMPNFFHGTISLAETYDLILRLDYEKDNTVRDADIFRQFETSIDLCDKEILPHWSAYAHWMYGRFAKKKGLMFMYPGAIKEARNRFDSLGFSSVVSIIEQKNTTVNFIEEIVGNVTTPNKTMAGLSSSTTVMTTGSTMRSKKQAPSLIDLEPQEEGSVDIRGLFSNLLPIILQNTGATRVTLVLNSEPVPLVAAQITPEDTSVVTINEELNSRLVSVGMVNTVLRSGRHVEANDVNQSNFKFDDRFKGSDIKSALAIAVPYQRRTAAVIYLEHDLMKDVFTKSKIEILHAILSVSLHNAEIFSSLNASYSRFLPRDFLNILGKKNVTEVEAGDATETDLCVLFMDIRSFTARTEKLSAKGSMKFVNTFMKYVCPAIEESHGIIDKFIGDAIMALFTGPKCTANAMAGAIKMMDALATLNKDHHSKDPVNIGIGMHYGKVMMGTVGYANRLDGTVIGDTVNQSSRCEGLTKALGAEIIVTDDLLEEAKKKNILDPNIHTRKLGKFLVKGKDFPIELYHAYGKDWDINFATDSELAEAMSLFNSNKLNEAAEAFEKLLEIHPQDTLLKFYLMASNFYRNWNLPTGWNGEIKLNKDGECQGIGEEKKSTPSEPPSMEILNAPIKQRSSIVWDSEQKKYVLHEN